MKGPEPTPGIEPAATRAGCGIVVAAFPDAAQAGAAILRRGGNAVDAACAAAWALSACESAESGLGGQTTMLLRLANGRTLVIDGHSRAPAALRRSAVRPRDQERGVRSCTIPSTPITLGEAQRRFGRLPLGQAIAPAIEVAENGYRITRLQRRLIRWTRPFFEPGSAEAGTFLRDGTKLPRVGEIFRQPLLAATLRRLAREGVNDFYAGGISREIVAQMGASGGLLSARDLAGIALPVDREPLAVPHRGCTVLSLPPPGGGVQVLLALRLMDELCTDGCSRAEWHLAIARATLAVFRERERWPDHPEDMSPTLARWLVSPERASSLMARARESTPGDPAGDSMGEEGNTTHLCTADGEGNVVSLTQSIQSVFGSKVMHPTLGFFYNNYLMTCPRTAHPYRLGAGSLPQSNAAPTIVLDAAAKPVLALGSAGSRRITTSVLQVLSAVLDRGESLVGAVGAPRAHALLSGRVWAERSIGQEALEALGSAFESVRVMPDHGYKLGAVHAIAADGNGGFVGAADPRRDGAVAIVNGDDAGPTNARCAG